MLNKSTNTVMEINEIACTEGLQANGSVAFITSTELGIEGQDVTGYIYQTEDNDLCYIVMVMDEFGNRWYSEIMSIDDARKWATDKVYRIASEYQAFD